MGPTLRRDNRSLKPAKTPARRTAFGLSLAVAVVAALIAPFAASAGSIPQGRGFDTAVPFYGDVAVAKPVVLQKVPQNPFMAAGNFSNIHNNSYMTDTYTQAGPLGKNTSVTSVYAKGECASVTFNSKGQIVAICLLPGKPAYLTMAATVEGSWPTHNAYSRVSILADCTVRVHGFGSGGYNVSVPPPDATCSLE
jgi:hypothetical protein